MLLIGGVVNRREKTAVLAVTIDTICKQTGQIWTLEKEEGPSGLKWLEFQTR